MKNIKKLNAKKIIIVVVSLCLVVALVYFGIVRDYLFRLYSVDQKLEDFNYLCETIEADYCFFEDWEESYPLSFEKLREQFKTKILKTDTDKQFLNLLNEFMIEIRDPHSYLVNPKEFWIIASNIELKREYIGEEAYNTYKELNDLSSENYKYWSRVISHNYKKNKAYSYSSSGYSVKEYPELNTIYVKIPMFTLTTDEREEIKQYLLNKATSNIILDIRDNAGGYIDDWSEYILPAIIKNETSVSKYGLLKRSQVTNELKEQNILELSNLPVATLDPFITANYSHFFEVETKVKPVNSKKGYDKLFLLVNQHCLSASEQLISWVKYSNTGTIVGSKSGGIDSGYSKMYTLPNTKLQVRISNTRILFPDGTIRTVLEGTPPDIECNPQKALEVVLDIIKN
ncbi:hypothetical protein IMX26_14645 [Clostridium sp. 'deep sea']|uniref:S41 family peptidase n=1 Tax=Clostridium sp. 'deep sea' TaxID=2779445 RepID=UPI0018969778|nr:S41 family peptidase [Clostridium sp. 'deep sea']QOR34694.1 hypothetical protein IMX26_14645 [Clostridium sp. 'deep sea']